MKHIVSIALFLLILPMLKAQNLSPVLDIRDERPKVFAFTNATIFVNDTTKIEPATLVIRNGKIESVGTDLAIPSDAVVRDLKGKFVYPSFIDLYSTYGVEAPANTTARDPRSALTRQQVFESRIDGPYYWNDAIKPYADANQTFHVNAAAATELKKLGFGAVLTQKHDGIMQGVSSLVSLADDDEEQVVLRAKAAAGYSFDKGTSEMSYPSSPMGVIALIRQTFYDADWYSKQTDKTFYDESLESVIRNKKLLSVIQTKDKINLLKADEIAREFGLNYIIKGSGDEYQLINEIKKTGSSLLLPVNFPEVPDVTDAYKAILVPLEDLKHWELAPYNPARVAEQNIPFAFTTDGLREKKQFRDNLLKAVKCGLKKEDALKALTMTPAKMLGCDKMLGSLEKGKIASFFITSEDYFNADCVIYENWVQGKRYVFEENIAPELPGTYALKLSNNEVYKITIAKEKATFSLNLDLEENKKEAGKITVSENLISLAIQKDKKWLQFSGWIKGKEISGTGVLANGENVTWKLEFLGDEVPKNQDKKKEENVTEPGKVIYPFVAYGYETRPECKDFVIRNATVWTSEKDGILQNSDVLVKNGKIAAVGSGLKTENVWEIDGTGMHLTPGIIDEHSHIALYSVNEGTHAVTSEVRMKDVVNPEDLTIYRQLAGGVTSSHLLHGSTNPIGGQSVLIKLKWGTTPSEMIIKDQVGFLKHALGENVKQSSFSSSSRFPQTRMGVEQSIHDAYVRAKEYQQKWNVYNSLPAAVKAKTQQPRKDLQLDPVVDEFNFKSFMVCHTYVQSETNMILELAKEFGIKPHTLIHDNEGYKLANEMKAAGAAGSVFSDLWNYKYEVYDAITYNAALLWKQGVLVCINSDYAEIGRHLNQEAGKIVKYGGLSEVEALKLVTINPAKVLHLDDRTGSIKVGKDADLVLWTDNPLSVYANASKTFVDGTLYYDFQADKEIYRKIQAERARIINKIIAEGGNRTPGASGKKPPLRINDQFNFNDEDISDDSETNYEK